jgi:hypothetical protein
MEKISINQDTLQATPIQSTATDQAAQQVQLPVVERKPYSSLMDYDVIAITSKVKHEFLVPKDVDLSDFIDDLIVYVLDYEDAYPDLEDPDLWTWIVDNYVDKRATTP